MVGLGGVSSKLVVPVQAVSCMQNPVDAMYWFALQLPSRQTRSDVAVAGADTICPPAQTVNGRHSREVDMVDATDSYCEAVHCESSALQMRSVEYDAGTTTPWVGLHSVSAWQTLSLNGDGADASNCTDASQRAPNVVHCRSVVGVGAWDWNSSVLQARRLPQMRSLLHEAGVAW